MNDRMNKNMRIWLILITLVVVAILVILLATLKFWFPPPFLRHRLPPPYELPEDIEFFYITETIVSTINVALSVLLLLTYVSIYRKTRSEFTIGLMIFSAVFFLTALASNPLIIGSFGFQPVGLGPFAMLPDLFTCGALIVLLYLSVKY